MSEFVASCDRDVFEYELILRQAVLNKLNTRNSTSICIKDIHPRTRVIAWLKGHPETHQMATEDGLYTACKDLYPCHCIRIANPITTPARHSAKH